MSGKMKHCDSQIDIIDNKGTLGNVFPASPCNYGVSPGAPGWVHQLEQAEDLGGRIEIF